MIIIRTPFRISFFGGGTDYPVWYRIHGGSVLATTINKYCYITSRYLPPFFDHRIRLVYSKTETCQTVDEVLHPAARAILRHMKIERGVEIHHDGDLPARSGVGSSSAFTVGMLHALYALKGQIPSKKQLAAESIHIEQEILRESVGSQDQVLAAHGGFNHVIFSSDCEILVRPMTLTRARISELSSHLMLFYTGIKRTASSIAQTYVPNLNSKEKEMRFIGNLVNEAIAILTKGEDIGRFGRLLHEAWLTKRSLSHRVSNSDVEGMYEQALSAGALGGKLIGAGGGGFMLLFVRPRDHRKLRELFRKFIYVPFKFEQSGSEIIFFDPEEDYSAEEQARGSLMRPAFKSVSQRGVV